MTTVSPVREERKSLRNRYWHCGTCQEMKPYEEDNCQDCGSLRPGAWSSKGNFLGLKIPKGLQGDKMYIHRQNGKQVMDSMQAKQTTAQKEQKYGKILRQIDRTRQGAGSLEHYRGHRG